MYIKCGFAYNKYHNKNQYMNHHYRTILSSYNTVTLTVILANQYKQLLQTKNAGK